MVPEDTDIPVATHEREFWKRYHSLRRLLDHLREDQHLVHQIRGQTVIPEQARDMAIHAITGELTRNYPVFIEFLADFIGFASQGLHKVDLHVDFTTVPGGPSEIDHCHLLIDGRKLDLPFDVGRRFIEKVPYEEGWEAVLSFYREEETRCDRMTGGSLDRCSLVIHEEIFPTRCYHISMRLPAQLLAAGRSGRRPD
jgi:hypothetical protein